MSVYAELHDGRRLEFPDGTDPAVIQATVKKVLGAEDTGTLKNVAMGALKGASDIGSTLLTPVAAVVNAISPGAMLSGDERRAAIRSFMEQNADPDSLAFTGGEIASGVAGTAGIGGVLGAGLKAVPALAKFAPVVESGGFSLGNAATKSLTANAAMRAAGGAAIGGTSAGLIDPNTAETGALIGGASPLAVKAAGAIGSGLRYVAKNTVGAATGAGGEAISQAFKAGKSGNKSFLNNLRGNADMTAVLDDAKSALSVIRAERAAQYRQGMAQVSGDKTVIDMSPILDSVKRIQSMGSFKGQTINKNSSGTVQEIADTISNWATLDPTDFHTPEGLDALKQAISDIRDTTQYGTAARKAVDTVYNSIKSEITKQAPVYSKTMSQYSEASDLIHEIERSLTGTDKTSVDTAMRKLQSLMRNNVNTNYGNRLDLAKELEARGADILPTLAGQALSSATPRGLQGAAAIGTGLYAMRNLAALGLLAAQSPRLMGEAAYGLGRVAGGSGKVTQGLLGGPRVSAMLQDPGLLQLGTLIPAISLSR